MPATETTALADQLACCVQQLEPAEQHAQLALFRLLAGGAPVTPARLAGKTGQAESEIGRYLDHWHGVERRDGAVIAFQGLSLDETPHRFRVADRELYTWCAWDTLFLPEILGHPAEVASRCPATGERISMRVDDDGAHDVSPQDTVLSFRPASPVFVDGVRERFCRFVHFFSSPAAAEPWAAGHPGTVVISVSAGFEIGRRTNAAQLGAALHRPVIELLYFDGCPSYEQLLPSVERLADEADAALHVRRIESPEAAERECFLGSPTLRVNGVDVDPTASGRTDFGLKCRIYRSQQAQSPVPPDDWIRAALRRSADGRLDR